MITLKCRNCGGEMSVDIRGELGCPYCGSLAHFSDGDLAEYKEFRLNMLNFLRASADARSNEADGTFLWEYHKTEHFVAKNGSDISVNYLFYANDDGVDTFVAKDSVVMIFKRTDSLKINKMLSEINNVEYPSADLKNLRQYFPTVKSKIELKDGGMLLAIAKPENVYPLYAFGNIGPKHAAWIVSRMENFCCVFEFSDMVHNGISTDSVYINPKTHEAYLYGGWWKAESKGGRVNVTDLLAVRKVADKLLGPYKNEAPELFRKFIAGRPAEVAYDDFAIWDEVIEKGFGGHNFTKFGQ